jgi:hypothetical protein
MALIQKAFSDIITFSRSSNATRVGQTGLVEYAPHNLLLQSQDFSTTWTNTRSSEVVNAVAAPDGTVTADKLVEDSSASNDHVINQTASVSSSTTYTTSIFLKAGERTWAFINMVDVGISSYRSWFNLSTGQTGTNDSGNSSTITSVGNGWYRCTVTRATTSSQTSVRIEVGLSTGDGVINYTGDGTSGIYLWGAQLSVGPYALDYTPTTTAAVYGPRFDYDGSGVTIVEPVSRNLVIYSEDLSNAAWDLVSGSISTNATTAPDGTITADRLTIGTVGFWFQSRPYSTAGVLTGSIWLKASSNITVGLRVADSGAGTQIQNCNVTTSWQRFTVTFTTDTSINTIYLGLDQRTALGGPGTAVVVDAWGAQFEVGSTATAYMVSGATNGFRAVPVVSGSATPKGLLIEEQRTNLQIYSEDFSSGWSANNVTLSSNVIASPSGIATADKLIADSTLAGHWIYYGFGSTSGSHTWSVYAKAGEYSWLGLNAYVGGNNITSFDLTNGVIGTNAAGNTATIAPVGNGWYRCTVSRTGGAATYTELRIGNADNSFSFSGNGSDGIYLWGAQLEAGSFATSYIPTLAASVTRSADVASVNTLSPWYNATEGTLYAEWSMIASRVGSGYPAIAQFDDTTNTEYIAIRQDGTGDSHRYGIVNTSTTTAAMLAGTAESLSANTTLKSALAYKANDFAFTRGSTLGTASTGNVPTVTNLKLGRNENSVYINAHLRRIAYYPRRLTNAELQSITS